MLTRVETGQAPRWSKNEIIRLKTMWKAGRSASQIADAIGHDRTRNAVIGKLQRLGLSESSPNLQGIKKGEGVPRPVRRQRHRADHLTTKIASGTFGKRDKIAPVKLSQPPDKTTHVTLIDARPFQCRAIVGEPDGPQTVFCGARTDGGSWCEWHQKRFYQPPQRRRDRVPLYAIRGRA